MRATVAQKFQHVSYRIEGTAALSRLWHTSRMTDPDPKNTPDSVDSQEESNADDSVQETPERPREIGGRGGLDPTRYGDWEKSGRCIDF